MAVPPLTSSTRARPLLNTSTLWTPSTPTPGSPSTTQLWIASLRTTTILPSSPPAGIQVSSLSTALSPEAVLPEGSTYTFWGRGVSQGHSDAIRRIPGVKDAKQYTVPVQDVVDRIQAGERPELTTRDKHLRECYVVAEEGADKAAIEEAIVTMENYFADYDTTVTFISEEELLRDHSAMPHGGQVIRAGETSPNTTQVYGFTLTLDSNPEFTGSMLVATARAAARLAAAGERGCRTRSRYRPALYVPIDADELRAHFL
ncbi:MAG: diaminopimelate dehydrogenase [Lawsonella clevelandensis]